VAFTAFAVQAACSGLAVVLATSPQQILVVGVTGFAVAAAATWGVLVHAGRGAVDRQLAAEVTRLDSPRALQEAGEWAEPLRERK
jgi:hypothetical protein